MSGEKASENPHIEESRPSAGDKNEKGHDTGAKKKH